MDAPKDESEGVTKEAPRGDAKGSPRKWELLQFSVSLLLALATISIAIVAYSTATRQTELSLRTAAILQFADVRPVPILWGDEEVECENGEAKFGLMIANYGSGPAIIRSVVALVPGDDVTDEFEFTPEDLSLNGMPDAGVLGDGSGGITTTSYLRRDRLLAAGSCLLLLKNSTLTGEEPDSDWRKAHVLHKRSLRVVVTFDSAAGPSCVSDTRYGGAPKCNWNGKPFP